MNSRLTVTVPDVMSAVGNREETVRLRNLIRLEFGGLYEDTLRILARNDPLGLISGGSPETDEYDPEVRTILLRLREADSKAALRRIVHQEFQHWFNPKIAGSERNYSKIADEIWSASTSFRTQEKRLKPETRRSQAGR